MGLETVIGRRLQCRHNVSSAWLIFSLQYLLQGHLAISVHSPDAIGARGPRLVALPLPVLAERACIHCARGLCIRSEIDGTEVLDLGN